MRARIVSGSLLIILGLALLGINRLDVGGELAVVLLGSAFLVWYAFSRQYGLLIPGAILTGLGLGIIVDELGYAQGDLEVLGLGLGFIAIFVIDRMIGNRRPGGWWPLIPGGILTMVGLEQTAIMELLGDWWPAALVGAGLVMLMGKSKPSSTQKPSSEGPNPPPEA